MQTYVKHVDIEGVAVIFTTFDIPIAEKILLDLMGGFQDLWLPNCVQTMCFQQGEWLLRIF